MRAAIVGIIIAGGMVAGFVWLFDHEGKAIDAAREESQAKHQAFAEMHTATPKAWAHCRSICGESAALLPAGDGSVRVVCSCLPPGMTVGVAR